MKQSDFNSLFVDLCNKNQITAPNEEQLSLFWRFTEHLMMVNETTNLTAIRNIPDVIAKHYVDSLTASASIPESARVLDLGCGPGFPSTPLAIMRPDLSIVALDSTDKKVQFVAKSAEILHLSNLKAVTGRAEAAETRKQLGAFDVVVSRAVSRMNVLCELSLPYLKIGGKLLALKGAKGEEELTEAAKAIKILGGEAKITQFLLKIVDTEEQRSFLEVVKIKETPPQYPRAYATILKKPLL